MMLAANPKQLEDFYKAADGDLKREISSNSPGTIGPNDLEGFKTEMSKNRSLEGVSRILGTKVKKAEDKSRDNEKNSTTASTIAINVDNNMVGEIKVESAGAVDTALQYIKNKQEGDLTISQLNSIEKIAKKYDDKIDADSIADKFSDMVDQTPKDSKE